MLNNSNQISEAILNAIDIISDKKISKAEFSSTIQGTIVDCKDASLGKYLVKYQDSLLEAYSTSPSVTYSKDSLVYIFVPDGNLKEYKVILGTTKQLGTNYIEEFTGEEYFDAGENFISSDYTIEMSSYQTKQYELFNRNSKNNIIILSDNIANEIRNANYLKMTGTIQTGLPYDQKRNGHYGVRITLIMKNSATGVEEPQDYYFDNNNFFGNPYEYTVASNQVVSCQIDSDNFVAVDRIVCFVQDFPNQVEQGEEPPAADIFIYNFAINGSYKLSDSEKSSVAIVLKSERGYTFGEGSSDNDTRPIVANLRVKMKEVNLEQQNVQIYWFIQDLKITSRSPQYLNYGGRGWRCINEKVISDSETPNRFNSSPSIEIKKEDVVFSKQTKFKCVAIYDNKSYSKQFLIFNQGAKHEVTLVSSEGTSFHHSAGHPNLICQVWSEENGKRTEITDQENKIFKWQVCNYQNKTTDIIEDDVLYAKALKNKAEIKDAVGVETYWNQTCEVNGYYDDFGLSKQESLKTYKQFYDLYNEIISSYENNQHLKRNILYNVNLQEIINSSTFRCSCYKKEEKEDGSIIQQLIGTASIEIKNTPASSNGYVLVINHGDQTFLYNEEGASLHSNAIDEPYQLFDLSYTLYYNGNEIKQEDLRNGTTVTWKVPIENTMLDMGSNEYITDTENNLPIGIKNTYDNSLSNNDIYLIMQYKDQTFITKTNFTFSKQGQNGTNGTKYQFKLKVKDNKEPVITYKNGQWEPESLIVEPELWNNGIKTEINGILNWKILKDNLKGSSSMLSNDFKPVIQKGSNLKDRQFNLQERPSIVEGLSNIIEAQYSSGPDGYKYYADLPISSIIQQSEDDRYNVRIKPGTGFRYVTYSNDGTKPSYRKGNPFEVNIYKTIINDIEEEVTNYQNEEFTYEWEVLPRESKLLQIVSKNDEDDKNICTAVPVDVFTKGNQVDNALLLTIKKGKEEEGEEKPPFAQVHIPIHFMLNRYENRALNDWNGTAIEINNEDGYILTPQVGAGKKDQDNNSFTGIIMGQTKTKDKDQTGLFGYAAGARSIFLDAKTGNATFGLADKGGQIEIDVANEDAIIKSSDYPIDKTTGKSAGMEIRFSGDPHIKFGSGNFEVSPEGHIHAVGGGDIAGWNVSDDSLFKGGVKISSDNKDDINPEEIDNTKKAIEVTDGEKNIFSVDYRGYLHSEQGDIAGWTIEPDKLFKDNVGMASTGEHAFWAGDNFYVNHNGYLLSKDGRIGGWNITEDRLVNDTGNVGMSTGVKIGDLDSICFWGGTTSISNQVKLNFWVTNSGILHTKYGEIGAWKIANGGLYSDGVGNTTQADNIYVYDKQKQTYQKVVTSKTTSGISSLDKNNYTFYNTTGGVYIGADGIRFGNYFSVTQGGGLQATGGRIGGITIDNSGLSASNWRIDGSGTAYFTNAYINGSDIVSSRLSGTSSGGGVSGGGMKMGSGGPGSSYMNPGVKTSPNGQTWEEYIKNKIEESLTRDKIINALQDGSYTIDFGNYQIRAKELSAVGSVTAGSNVYADNVYAGGKLATESYVDNAIQNIPKT